MHLYNSGFKPTTFCLLNAFTSTLHLFQLSIHRKKIIGTPPLAILLPTHKKQLYA